MALLGTPAIVLSALRFSETSKIVRLATRDYGVQSAIAKGALRPKSRFGAALQLLSEGQAQLLTKEHRELHTLTAFDLQHLHVGLAGDLARYATASALAEVMQNSLERWSIRRGRLRGRDLGAAYFTADK